MAKKVVMDYWEAKKIERRYVCNICWRDLEVVHHGNFANHLGEVGCRDPECSGTGFVTRNYVERRRLQDHFDYLDAMRWIGDVLGIAVHRTLDENLKILGF